MATPVYHPAVLDTLAAAGAHFVLAKADKRAVEKNWQKDPPQVAAVKAWVAQRGNLVGIKPTSVGLVVVDLDEPENIDVARVVGLLGEPLASVPTSKPGHVHLWYRKPAGMVGNRKWADPETQRLGGDIRCSKGYAILWDAAAVADVLGDVADADAVELDKLPKHNARRDKVRNAPAGARNDTLNEETFGAMRADDADPQQLEDAAVAAGLPREEAKKTRESAESGAADAVLASRLRLHEMTARGFSLRLLEADAHKLLLASYVHKGEDRTYVYSLQDTGIWRRQRDKLKNKLDLLVDRAVVEEHRAQHLDGRLLTQSLKLRQGEADRTLDRLPVAYEKWLAEGHPKVPLVVTARYNDLDPDGRYLGCGNGVVDLSDGRLLPAHEARQHLVTRSTHVVYRPDATHELLPQLTANMPAEIEDYAWAALGRMMWGVPAKECYLLVGPTNSAKSTLVVAVDAALGEEADGLKKDVFVGGRDGKEGPTPAKAPLATSRFVYAIEARTWKIDPEALKNAAGAVDTVTYEEKYMPPVTRKVRATIWLTGNDLPKLDWLDEALVDRLRVIRVPTLSSLDHRMETVIFDHDFREALLAKLVRYAATNPVGTSPPPPPAVDAESRRHIANALGQYGAWLRDALVLDAADALTFAEMWDAWAAHMKADPADPAIGGQSRSTAGAKLMKVMGVYSSRFRPAGGGKTVYGWRGVRLATEADLVCFAPLPGSGECGQPLNAAGQCDVADTHEKYILFTLPAEDAEVFDRLKRHLEAARGVQLTDEDVIGEACQMLLRDLKEENDE